MSQVDEQLTLTSQIKSPENRPSVMSIFGPPPASNPVDVPKPKSASKSISAPSSAHTAAASPSLISASPDVRPGSDTLSIGGSSTDTEDDEFARLKEIREQERQKKLLEKLSISISNQPPEMNPETESLLTADKPIYINVVPQKPATFDDACLWSKFLI